MIVVSVIGIDKFSRGYAAAKVAHEHAMLSGPIPTRIVRAAQFHELIPQGLEWGRQGDVIYVSRMRSQPVAARAVNHHVSLTVTLSGAQSASAQACG